MDIKLIAVDMDGTLLDDCSKVSNENLKAIRRLSEKGIAVVPVTGRTYYEIPSEMRDEECVRFFVFSNGSGIYERGRGVLYSSTIERDTAAAVYSLLSSYETFIEIYSGGYPWADKHKMNQKSFDYYKINPRFQQIIMERRRQADDFAAMLEAESLKPELFDAFFKSMDDRAECLERMNYQYPELEVVSSMGNNLEIMNRGTNKGTGLKKLCDILSLDIGKTLALGDSKNDMDMFKAAGVSYAVSNACDEIKAAANGIICSNNENVIKYVEDNVL
ncbi:MAG: Cof-type HAD-IIB family hydrolase [Eubacterium sp.]|nr:Cof-type HAD-IIB family hydrolase [Eubacterium sp.]